MIHDPLALLGKPIDDGAIASFLAAFAGTLAPPPPDSDLPDRRYFVGDAAEVELLADTRNTLLTIFLYLNGHKGHREYRGPLPLTLHAGMTQEEVRGTLGSPQFERPGGEDEHLGQFGPIDRWDFPEHSIHLEYSDAHGGIVQVTVTLASAVPERADVH